MKKNPKKKNSDNTASRVAKDMVPHRMPQLLDQLAVGMVLRFMSTASFTGSTTITFQNLLDAWFLAGTATNAYQLFDFVRIKKVVLRAACGPSGSGGGVVGTPVSNIGIEFPGLIAGAVGGGKQVQVSNLGTAEVAMAVLKPDPRSQLAQFQDSSSDQAFIVRAAEYTGTPLTGVVCDVHVVYRNSADVSPAALQNAVAGATPGALYFGGMDGKRLASTHWRCAFVGTL